MILQMYMSHGKNHREEDLKKYGYSCTTFEYIDIAFDGASKEWKMVGQTTFFVGSLRSVERKGNQ